MNNTGVGGWQRVNMAVSIMPAGTSSKGPNTGVGGWQRVNMAVSIMPAGTSSKGPKGCTK